MGCEIVEIVIPDLEANRIAHSVTIISEMAQAVQATYDEHHREHGLDVRVTLRWDGNSPLRIISRHSASALG